MEPKYKVGDEVVITKNVDLLRVNPLMEERHAGMIVIIKNVVKSNRKWYYKFYDVDNDYWYVNDIHITGFAKITSWKEEMKK